MLTNMIDFFVSLINKPLVPNSSHPVRNNGAPEGQTAAENTTLAWESIQTRQRAPMVHSCNSWWKLKCQILVPLSPAGATHTWDSPHPLSICPISDKRHVCFLQKALPYLLHHQTIRLWEVSIVNISGAILRNAWSSVSESRCAPPPTPAILTTASRGREHLNRDQNKDRKWPRKSCWRCFPGWRNSKCKGPEARATLPSSSKALKS